MSQITCCSSHSTIGCGRSRVARSPRLWLAIECPFIFCQKRNEGLNSSAASGTFQVNDGSYYYCVLEILLGRLSKPLYNQALKKISKFMRTNILPGAIGEFGLLCCSCVHSNPEEAVSQVVEPILLSVISSLKGTPRTGFGDEEL
ncbi:hypothetical protein QN277_023582 [Acacia crassicarpa]|uniref:Uncharacterized protein n=1 Tax=Acacia crassicarpa TaxID=499986 RepID=A0AAE1KD95_9FABA|nr:hypothetical protein QN277_023582 [Acacia crassicarpa]